MYKSYGSHRGKNSGRFLKLDYWILRTPAWESLTAQQVRVLLLLLERYNGSNNGRIGLSIREASKFGNIAQGTSKSAFDKLVKLGFIKRRRIGSFNQKQRLATEYELTFLPYGKKSATKEFASWKPKEKTVAKGERQGIILGEMTNDAVL